MLQFPQEQGPREGGSWLPVMRFLENTESTRQYLREEEHRPGSAGSR